MTKKMVWATIAFCVALACLVLTVVPAEAAGRVEAVTGTVTLERDGRTMTLGAGDSLRYYDTIITGEDGKVKFTLTQVGDFRLDNNTRVSIDDLFEDAEDEPMVLRMVAGYLWAKIRKFHSKPRGLEIHTPTAIAGVRGTEFELLAGLDGSTAMVVDEGTVTLAVNGDELEVGSGAMVEVDIEKGLGPLAYALEKHRRNWQAWRAESAKRLELGLSVAIERATGKVSDLEAKIDESGKLIYARAETLTAALDALDQAVNTLDRASIKKAWQNLRSALQELLYGVRDYKRDLNKILVVANFASSLEQAIDRTDHNLPPETVAELKGRLAETAATRERLVSDSLRLRKDLIELFRDMRKRINVIVTSKLSLDEWSQIFGNEHSTKAFLDQLPHWLKIFQTSEDRHRSNSDNERTGNNAQ